MQLLVAIFVTGFIVAGAAVYLLDRYVLKRIGRLGSDLTNIRVLGDLSLRVGESGDDELGALVDQINDMLASLEGGHEYINKTLQNCRLGFAGTFDNVELPMVLCDSDGQVTQVNAAFTENLGCGFNEMNGRPLDNIFASSDFRLGETLLRHTRPGVGPLMKTCRMGSGDTVDVTLRVSAVYDTKGAVLHILVQLGNAERVQDRDLK